MTPQAQIELLTGLIRKLRAIEKCSLSKTERDAIEDTLLQSRIVLKTALEKEIGKALERLECVRHGQSKTQRNRAVSRRGRGTS